MMESIFILMCYKQLQCDELQCIMNQIMSVNRKLWNFENREQGTPVLKVRGIQALLSLDSYYVYEKNLNSTVAAIAYILAVIFLEISNVV